MKLLNVSMVYLGIVGILIIVFSGLAVFGTYQNYYPILGQILLGCGFAGVIVYLWAILKLVA